MNNASSLCSLENTHMHQLSWDSVSVRQMLLSLYFRWGNCRFESEVTYVNLHNLNEWQVKIYKWSGSFLVQWIFHYTAAAFRVSHFHIIRLCKLKNTNDLCYIYFLRSCFELKYHSKMFPDLICALQDETTQMWSLPLGRSQSSGAGGSYVYKHFNTKQLGYVL